VPPAGVRIEEFDSVISRAEAIVKRAEEFLEYWRMNREKTRVWDPDEESIIGDDSTFTDDDHAGRPDESTKSKFRSHHAPVLAYRGISLFLVCVWMFGFIAHGLEYWVWEIDRHVEAAGAERRLGFSSSFSSLSQGGVIGRGFLTPRSNLLEPSSSDHQFEFPVGPEFRLPEEFFDPHSFILISNRAGAPARLVASNGFVVYSVSLDGSDGLGAELLECPVDEHFGLVSASCNALGCSAVVSAPTGLWQCGAVSQSGEGALAFVSETYAQSRQPLRLWAAVGKLNNLTHAFAAPKHGPIVHLRRFGTTVFKPVAEITAPVRSKHAQRLEWQILQVHDDILTAVATPGPRAFSWSVSSGRLLRKWFLPDWAGTSRLLVDDHGGLYGIRKLSIAGGTVQLWHLREPPLTA